MTMTWPSLTTICSLVEGEVSCLQLFSVFLSHRISRSGDIGGVVVKSSNQHSFRASGNEEGGVPDLCGSFEVTHIH